MTTPNTYYTDDKKSTICFDRLENQELSDKYLFPVPGQRDAASIAEILINCGFYVTPLFPANYGPAEWELFHKDPESGWKQPRFPEYNDPEIWPNTIQYWLKTQVDLPEGREYFYKNKKKNKLVKTVIGDPNSNTGILCGGRFGVSVLDFDGSGLENLKKLLGDKFDEIFPPTFKSQTASGKSEHWYYLSDDFIPPSKSRIAPGVDVQGDGNHVVAPGSINPAGKAYRILDGRKPVRLTAEALKLIQAHGKAAKSKKAEGDTKKKPDFKTKWTVDSAVESILNNGDYKIGDDNRHFVLCKAAGRLRNQLPDDLDLERAIRLFAEKQNVDKNIPGAMNREDDLRQIIEDAVENFDCVPASKASTGGAWESGLHRTSMGQVRNNEDNLKKILINDSNFQVFYDEFSKSIHIDSNRLPRGNFMKDFIHKWDEADSFNTATWLQSEWDCEAKKADVQEAIFTIATEKMTRNLVKEKLLEYHSRWDGEKRLETMFIDYCGVLDAPHVRTTGKKFLLSAVARVFKPGCKVDTALLLINPEQGVGKSSFLFAIAPDMGPDVNLVLENLEGVDREGQKQTQGKLLVEFGEMAVTGRVDQEYLKSYQTRRFDNYRASYAREPKDYPRTFVIVGTTNDEETSNDTSGNRRWWPLKAKKIKNDDLSAIKEQLWGEAVASYLNNDQWWLTPEEEKQFVGVQAALVHENPWERRIADWLKTNCMTITTTYDICLHALNVPATSHRSAARTIKPIMAKLGWEQNTQRTWIKV